MPKLLVVDDDVQFCRLLGKVFRNAGHEVVCAGSIENAKVALQADVFDLVLLDVYLPDGKGLDLMDPLATLADPPELLVLTGNPNEEAAKTALEKGAWDYICKTDPMDRVVGIVSQALRFRGEKVVAATKETLRDEGIIGSSQPILKLMDAAARAAQTDSPVLITGESGTGKELFARAIHNHSARAHSKFVIVDCASTPGHLIESILFGHKKGSFTGATSDHAGLVALADRGTLFLDELGELPLEMQRSFLRVLQEKSFRPVGSTGEEKSDFRLVCATNKDLEKCVADGTFRSDLYHRIRAIHLHLPPLREREGDIPLLARTFLTAKADEQGAVKGFAPEIFEILSEFDWPGNVRELHHAIGATLANAQGHPTVYPIHLPPYVRTKKSFEKPPQGDPETTTSADHGEMTLKAFEARVLVPAEKSYFENLVQKSKGDFREAMRISGLSRTKLYVMLDRHGLSFRSARTSR